MERIGIDLDGVLNRIGRFHDWFHNNLKIPWWLFFFLIFLKPNKGMVEILRKLDERNIVIVSARPKQLEGLTRRWLKRYGIPFHQLCLVGLGKGVAERKLKIIRDLDIDIFIDNDPAIVKYLLENGVRAILGAAGKFLAAPFNFCKKAKRYKSLLNLRSASLRLVFDESNKIANLKEDKSLGV